MGRHRRRHRFRADVHLGGAGMNRFVVFELIASAVIVAVLLLR